MESPSSQQHQQQRRRHAHVAFSPPTDGVHVSIPVQSTTQALGRVLFHWPWLAPSAQHTSFDLDCPAGSGGVKGSICSSCTAVPGSCASPSRLQQRAAGANPIPGPLLAHCGPMLAQVCFAPAGQLPAVVAGGLLTLAQAVSLSHAVSVVCSTLEEAAMHSCHMVPAWCSVALLHGSGMAAALFDNAGRAFSRTQSSRNSVPAPTAHAAGSRSRLLTAAAEASAKSAAGVRNDQASAASPVAHVMTLSNTLLGQALASLLSKSSPSTAGRTGRQPPPPPLSSPAGAESAAAGGSGYPSSGCTPAALTAPAGGFFNTDSTNASKPAGMQLVPDLGLHLQDPLNASKDVCSIVKVPAKVGSLGMLLGPPAAAPPAGGHANGSSPEASEAGHQALPLLAVYVAFNSPLPASLLAHTLAQLEPLMRLLTPVLAATLTGDSDIAAEWALLHNELLAGVAGQPPQSQTNTRLPSVAHSLTHLATESPYTVPPSAAMRVVRLADRTAPVSEEDPAAATSPRTVISEQGPLPSTGRSRTPPRCNLSFRISHVKGTQLLPLLSSIQGSIPVMASGELPPALLIGGSSQHHDASLPMGTLHDVLESPPPGGCSVQQLQQRAAPLAQLHAKLGQGAFGCVYAGAWHGANVAIKVVPSGSASTGLGMSRACCQSAGAQQQQQAGQGPAEPIPPSQRDRLLLLTLDPDETELAAARRRLREAFELAAGRVVSHPHVVTTFATWPEALLQPLEPGKDLPAVLLRPQPVLAHPSDTMLATMQQAPLPMMATTGTSATDAAPTVGTSAANFSTLNTTFSSGLGAGPTPPPEGAAPPPADATPVMALAMELCDMGALADAIKQGVVRRMMMARDRAAALAAIHSALPSVPYAAAAVDGASMSAYASSPFPCAQDSGHAPWLRRMAAQLTPGTAAVPAGPGPVAPAYAAAGWAASKLCSAEPLPRLPSGAMTGPLPPRQHSNGPPPPSGGGMAAAPGRPHWHPAIAAWHEQHNGPRRSSGAGARSDGVEHCSTSTHSHCGASRPLPPALGSLPATPASFEALRQFLSSPESAPGGQAGPSGGGAGAAPGGGPVSAGDHETSLDLWPAYQILLEVASALRHLHSLRLVHGDVKPANVLLKSSSTDPRGWKCKLSDFGCVRLLREDTETGMLGCGGAADLSGGAAGGGGGGGGADPGGASQLFFNGGDTAGTVVYCAPEVLRNDRRLTAAVDIYAFGILMWELVSDGRPFAGIKQRFVTEGIKAGLRPALPMHVPEAYRQLMEQCWAPLPAARPTADELLATLQRHIAALPGPYGYYPSLAA